eukprot:CAMPEP_0172813042 /NCGR_PEP_ID=MMETSP1075-20121228/10416_1 /TAXON_ID=2916 /ORGANISM="Ceratium fusus, Strain PA161109" /LENGTH=267 /DNA_ID=CAMNT_0013652685 /DNA_START=51 /DNA_END=854 /DNA_ORIENTATION=-
MAQAWLHKKIRSNSSSLPLCAFVFVLPTLFCQLVRLSLVGLKNCHLRVQLSTGHALSRQQQQRHQQQSLWFERESRSETKSYPRGAGGRNSRSLLSCCSASDVEMEQSPPLVSAGKPLLTLEAADAMASAAIAEAKSKKFKDISVFVLDASTRVLVSKTMLNCPPLIPELAHGKAGAAIGTHSSSRALKDKYVPDRTPQLLAMTTIGGNSNLPFCAVPGGVLIRDTSSNVLGAIGVSGASADEDEHCAIVGAQSVGCMTEPAKSALP